jgi:lipopolysaccharide export LptBFGC system permease protein LptF
MPELNATLALIVLSFVLMGAGFTLRNQRPGIAVLALGIALMLATLFYELYQAIN